MSSRYTRQLDHCRPARTRSIRRWNVAGALHSSKDFEFKKSIGGTKCSTILVSLFHLHWPSPVLWTTWTHVECQVYRRSEVGGRHPFLKRYLASCNPHTWCYHLFSWLKLLERPTDCYSTQRCPTVTYLERVWRLRLFLCGGMHRAAWRMGCAFSVSILCISLSVQSPPSPGPAKMPE